MSDTVREPKHVRRLRRVLGETRSFERIREHYEVEKRLASKLMASSREQRGTLYAEVYDEFMRCVLDNCHHRWRNDSAHQARQQERSLRLLRRFLRPDSVYLELGPGDCAVAFAVAGRVKRVYAIDVSREIAARPDCPQNFQLLISDGTSVPVPAESVDVAYSDQLMEHVHPDDAAAQLHNLYCALRPGGVYVCRTPNALSGPHDISAFFDDRATGFHLKEYTYGELTGLFSRAGFRRVRAIIGARGINLPFQSRVAPLLALERLLSLLPLRLRKRLARTLPLRCVLNIQLVATK